MRKNKFAFSIILVFFIIFLSGCIDPNRGKRPFDYEPAKWISSNPKAWFEVNPDRKNGLNYYNPIGLITVNGKTTEFVLVFDHYKSVAFCKRNAKQGYDYSFDEALFIGKCKFNPEKLVIKIVSDEAGILDDKVKEIVFERITKENMH